MILTGSKGMFSDTQLIASNAMHPKEKLKLRTMFKKFNSWSLVEQFMIWIQHLMEYSLNSTILTLKPGLTTILFNTYKTFQPFTQEKFVVKLLQIIIRNMLFLYVRLEMKSTLTLPP